MDWALTAEVPQAPGETPIPVDHVRLYHYTSAGVTSEQKHEVAEQLRTGIDITKAKGSTYGEPNVVWASTEMPYHLKVFAEFHVAMDDPRWGQGKPDPTRMTPKQYEAMKWDCWFLESIRPDEIVAVHEPWHGRYRYMVKNNLIDKAKAGEFDYLLNNTEYGPAVRKAKSS